MASTKKVALITGGASGMGLAVAQALSDRGGWDIHIVDMNVAAGNAASISIPATFHQANVTSYPAQSSIFKTVFQESSRLDFVFANAGIAEKTNFYETHDTGIEPPPPISLLVADISLNAVILTSYLALHYFRLSKIKGQDKSLIMTASCGGIYPSYYSPAYSAAKHGVVGLMRSIAKSYWTFDQIRVNSICPGLVKTNLLTATEWGNFPEQFFTPVEKIVEGVLILLDGNDPVQDNRIDAVVDKGGILWGEALEISGTNHYYREAPKVCDDAMQAVMKATDIQELEH